MMNDNSDDELNRRSWAPTGFFPGEGEQRDLETIPQWSTGWKLPEADQKL